MPELKDDTSTARPPTLREWAQGLAPRLDVVSASVPEPHLAPGDTLAIFHSADVARELVLSWERIEPADESVGYVALGVSAEQRARDGAEVGADPEGVASHAMGRVWRGAVPGAVVGAAAVGVTVGVATGNAWATIGAALGGAAFGGVAGAMFGVVKGTGWGEAYKHAFVDPEATDLVVASFHSNDPSRVDAAEQAARSAGEARLARVAADGNVVPYDR